MEAATPDELVDSDEVATILGLQNRSSVSVYAARYDDFPTPWIRRGKAVLWRRSDIEAWNAHRHR